ncbi:DUF4982 domain-containing protein [Segetibacter sp.]|jgi:hypothetical protein|uniref:DUF4982 domain-containing protein n=1 Tax=Segetibacter sp. TaxID=2231182 RepID=UPI00261349ED|nr:DUF4982 domain-containing protein [Segetibacter sp.]MCW3080826.1 hypothetical protein [Segetibacter sp.]
MRVELNGKVVGEKTVSTQTKLTATFNVPYEKGVLKGYKMAKGRFIELSNNRQAYQDKTKSRWSQIRSG